MIRITKAVMVLLLAVPFLFACSGGGDTGSSGDAGGTTTTTAETTPAAAATATISGKVMFAGSAPDRSKIKLSADPYCVEANAKPVFDESVVVGEDGSLENVFVYIKSGLEGQSFPEPTGAVVFDQKNCTYHPHVFGIRANQELQILNSDATLHNVHATPKNSPEFNVGMPKEGMKITKKFRSPEVMVHIKCEVHPWMSAYAGVLEHPYFAVAGMGGTFELPKIAPGTYTVEAWHEKLGTQTQEITVADGQMAEVSFEFGATP